MWFGQTIYQRVLARDPLKGFHHTENNAMHSYINRNIFFLDTSRKRTVISWKLILSLFLMCFWTLPFVLYGCEIWSLTLREEHRLRGFENRVLRRIFGVTGEWRKLHKEELNDLYCSPNIVRMIKSVRNRWAGHVARMKEGRAVHKVLVGKLEGK